MPTEGIRDSTAKGGKGSLGRARPEEKKKKGKKVCDTGNSYASEMYQQERKPESSQQGATTRKVKGRKGENLPQYIRVGEVMGQEKTSQA